MDFQQIIGGNAWIITLIAFLVIPIKGYALWTSAKRNEKWWFIALLIVNSLAILEIVYLLAIVKVHKKFTNKESSETKTSEPVEIK